jgi:hypothetical protein
MQLLRMVCENRPQWVAKLIAKDSKLLQRFFSGVVLGFSARRGRCCSFEIVC